MRAITILRSASPFLIAALFIVAGANHFLNPGTYARIVPDWLPAHAMLVGVSGVAEMLGGIGVLFTSTRRAAGVGLVVLLIAVFPANLQMAFHPQQYADLGNGLLFDLRLPLQAILIAWVCWTCLRSR